MTSFTTIDDDRRQLASNGLTLLVINQEYILPT